MNQNKIKNIDTEQRHTFTAEFVRTGLKPFKRRGSRNKYSPTLLLKNVKVDANPLTSQVWLYYGKNFLKLGKLIKGDVVQFNGRIDAKTNNSKRKYDYKIERPTKTKLITSNHLYRKVPTTNRDIIGMILEDNQDLYYPAHKVTDNDLFYKQCYEVWKTNNRIIG